MKQLIKFGLVGIVNTLVSEGIYFVLVVLGVNYLIATTAGFLVSVLVAFFLSNKYVFMEDDTKKKRVWWKVLLKTYTAYLSGFLINAVLLVVWIDVIEISRFMDPVLGLLEAWNVTTLLGKLGIMISTKMLGEVMAPLINLCVTIPVNFVLNKYWAYRQK